MSELGQQLISIVRRKAAETPDHVYQRPYGHLGCAYVHADRSPGCLIGQALCEAGVIGPDFYRTNHNTVAVGALIFGLDLDVDNQEATWLRAAQYAQDKSATWGEAVTEADAQVPL